MLIRGLVLYIPLLSVLALALQLRPTRRQLTGSLLATMWNLAGLLALNAIAINAGWWSFKSSSANVAGVPVDLWFGWAVLWGAVPVLCTTRRLWAATVGLVALDLVVMPLGSPVVDLHGAWLIGEAVGALFCLVPGLLLGMATARNDRLALRATLQLVAFVGLIFYVLPSLIFTVTSGGWAPLLDRPRWHFVAAAVVIAPFAAAGVQAVQEFVRSGGTPFPLDPPTSLATSGPYAYIANPMQVAGSALLAGWGLLLGSIPVVIAAVVAAVYSAGFATWSEGADLNGRFGEDWAHYRRNVRAWRPRLRPFVITPGTLYVAQSCGPCRAVGQFLAARHGTGLVVEAAESSPEVLTRITYCAGLLVEPGVAAIGRSLEHAHLGWAVASWMARLPGLAHILQLISDAVSGGPRAFGGAGAPVAD
jgi:protein-S-isoprenylcysteine O-methyltransferase Ste14